MKKLRGFTLIEILVAILILTAVAGIASVYANSYVKKATNTRIITNLSIVQADGLVWHKTHKTYDGFFSSPEFQAFYSDMSSITFFETRCTYSAVPGGCVTGVTSWCFCANLFQAPGVPVNTNYCVDSSGYGKQTSGATCFYRCNYKSGEPSCRD
jgi:prepilin-type N-terminal cleavage/methylation domain-containing protein